MAPRLPTALRFRHQPSSAIWEFTDWFEISASSRGLPRQFKTRSSSAESMVEQERRRRRPHQSSQNVKAHPDRVFGSIQVSRSWWWQWFEYSSEGWEAHGSQLSTDIAGGAGSQDSGIQEEQAGRQTRHAWHCRAAWLALLPGVVEAPSGTRVAVYDIRNPEYRHRPPPGLPPRQLLVSSTGSPPETRRIDPDFQATIDHIQATQHSSKCRQHPPRSPKDPKRKSKQPGASSNPE